MAKIKKLREKEKYVTKKQLAGGIIAVVLVAIFITAGVSMAIKEDQQKLEASNRVCVFNTTSEERIGNTPIDCENYVCATENKRAYGMSLCEGDTTWLNRNVTES